MCYVVSVFFRAKCSPIVSLHDLHQLSEKCRTSDFQIPLKHSSMSLSPQ